MKTALFSAMSVVGVLAVAGGLSVAGGASAQTSAGGVSGSTNCGPPGQVGSGGGGGVYGADPFPICAKAVASGGKAFAVGCSATSDANVYRRGASSWQLYSGINVAHVAASATGVPWVVRSDGRIYWHPAGSFQQVPGCANSIGVGTTSTDAWIVGCEAGANGAIWRFDGTQFVQVQSGTFRAIAVGSDNVPWIVDQANDVYRWDGSAVQLIGGLCVGAIGGGGWAVGCDGTSVWHFNDVTWVRRATLKAPATTISNDGKFVSDVNGTVLLQTCNVE